jgi:hypothetical protein
MCHHKSGGCKTPILQRDRIVGALFFFFFLDNIKTSPNTFFFFFW